MAEAGSDHPSPSSFERAARASQRSGCSVNIRDSASIRASAAAVRTPSARPAVSGVGPLVRWRPSPRAIHSLKVRSGIPQPPGGDVWEDPSPDEREDLLGELGGEPDTGRAAFSRAGA